MTAGRALIAVLSVLFWTQAAHAATISPGSPADLNVKIGETVRTGTRITVQSAHILYEVSYSVTSSDSGVAVAVATGENIVSSGHRKSFYVNVTGIKSGTATVTINASDDNGAATPVTFDVHVSLPKPTIDPALSDITLTNGKTREFSGYTIASTVPADSTVTLTGISVASSDPNIASVSEVNVKGDGASKTLKFNVDGKSSGTAIVKVTVTEFDPLSSNLILTEFNFTATVSPAMPDGFNATSGVQKVILNWFDPDDDGIDTYQVRYKAGTSFTGSETWGDISGSGATTTNHSVTGLANGTKYAFQIRAVNYGADKAIGGGDDSFGPASGTATATPQLDLSMPAGLTAAPGRGKAILNWIDPGDSRISKYQIRYKAGTSFTGSDTWSDIPGSGATTTSHSVTGLINDTEYAFQIRSYGGDSGTMASAPSTTVTTTPAALPPPSGIVAEPFDKEVELKWTNPGDNRILKYQIRHKAGTSFTGSDTWSDISGSGATTTSHSVTGLINDTEYAFQIRAVELDGGGNASAIVTATPAVFPAPFGFSATPGNRKVELNWIDPSDVSINKYQVRHKAGDSFTGSEVWSEIPDSSATTTSYTVTGLINETQYAFQIRAIGSVYESAASKTRTATPDGIAPSVTISGVPAFTGTSFTATFTFDEAVSGFAAEDITVTGATKGMFTAATGAGADRVWTLLVTPNANYRIEVKANAAENAAGNGNKAVGVSGIYSVNISAERQALKETLAGLARATLRSATAVVDRRFEASPGEAALTLAGEPVALVRQPDRDDKWATDFREPDARSRTVENDTLLGQSAFALPLGSAGSGWTMWSRGDLQQFESRSTAGSHDGSIRSGWLGVDGQLSPKRFAGIAVSRSHGKADYGLPADGSTGTLKTSLTALWAYLQLGELDGPRIRVLVGAGQGEAENRPTAAARPPERSDLTMQLASVSGRWPVARTDALALSLTGDAGFARMSTDGTGAALAGLEVEVRQFRAGIEARHDGMDIGDAGLRLVPAGSLLVRRDGGDGATGTGLEVEGGFALGRPGSRFSVDARGRWLLMHSASGVRDWGVGFEIRLAPDAKGRGLSYSLSTRWGAPDGGAINERDRVFAAPIDGSADGAALSMRAGYGFGAGIGVLTPFAETELGDDSKRYAAGFGFAVPGGLEARLAAERREPASGKAGNLVGLELRLTF